MDCCIKNARPDLNRCQAKKPNGNSTDGQTTWQRCAEPPEWIATEAEMSPDGYISSMALCDGCRQLLEKQSPFPCKFNRIQRSRCQAAAGTT